MQDLVLSKSEAMRLQVFILLIRYSMAIYSLLTREACSAEDVVLWVVFEPACWAAACKLARLSGQNR